MKYVFIKLHDGGVFMAGARYSVVISPSNSAHTHTLS